MQNAKSEKIKKIFAFNIDIFNTPSNAKKTIDKIRQSQYNSICV